MAISTIESNIYPINMQGVRFEQNDLSPLFLVGSNCDDNDGGRWIYVSFSTALAINSWVWVDETGAALGLLNATTPASQRPCPVGAIQFASPSGVSYGWIWNGGSGAGGVGSGIKGLVVASTAKDVPLYATGTSGVVGSSSTSHYQILGLTSCATDAGSGVAQEMFASLPLSLSGV